MDHRHRSLLAAQQYYGAVVLTKYSSKLLQESQKSANHRAIHLADESHGTVHSFMGKWYNVDRLQHTCRCGHFQYNEVPCGHAIAVIRAAEHGAPRDFVPYNLTVPSLRAAYAAPMAPVEIAGLEVHYTNLNPADGEARVALERSPLCRAPNFKKLGEAHKRRVAQQLVNKEHISPT